MIKVKFERNDESKLYLLKIDGHACAGDKGTDIICASASILAFTLAQMVSNMRKEGKLRKEPTVRLKEGDALIVCKPKDEAYTEALHTFYMAQVGYDLLAQNYPQFVELKIVC